MKSLIIGGTSSLGKCISEELISRGAELITISRSLTGLEKYPHFQCDVSEQDKLKSILLKIRESTPVLDSVWCVVGYAYPRKVEDQTPDVVKRHLDRNVSYVRAALESLKDNLSKSKDSKVVTFGSQWSYRPANECPELKPYIEAKQTLRKFTRNFALSNPSIKANHYCLPTTDTVAYRRIEETFREMLSSKVMKSYDALADPITIAKSLVEHALSFNDSAKTLIVKPNGLVKLL